MGGFFRNMRAIARRCFCPPESFTPRSPMIVSRPSGSDGDELVEARAARGLDDLALDRVQPAIGDVLADRAAEQEHVLLHDTDLAAQRGQRHVADVDAVDGDGARCRPRRSAAAASRWSSCRRPDGPTKAMVSPAAIVEVDVLQHRPFAAIAEA